MSISEQIERFIETEVIGSGAEGVVVGLSGGIDSAVVASLAVRALGSDKVLGLIMPCGSDPDDAIFAKKLQCPNIICDLSKAFKAMRGTLPFDVVSSGLLGNIKARLRMTTLYAYANMMNYIVLGTGNRTEIALGYFTKYGDGGCDCEPIGGLLKREVVRLAKELGVPQEIIRRAPSAGLWAGQTDEGDLGFFYNKLDMAVEASDAGVMDDALDVLGSRMVNSGHKRKMPPICTIDKEQT